MSGGSIPESEVQVLWALLWLVMTAAWGGSPARDAVLAGRLEDAVALARKEALAAPSDIAAQELYVDTLMSSGRAHVAQKYAAARAEKRPDDPDAQYLVGRTLLDPVRAKAAFDAALAIRADHPRSWVGLGALAQARGENAEAEAAFRKAVETDPTVVEGWTRLLSVVLATGRRDEALGLGRQAIVAVPDAAEPYLVVAAVDPGQAIDVLARGVERNPGDPRLHARLAEAALAEGDGRLAAKAAETALRIDPAHSDAGLSLSFARCMVTGTLDKAGYAAVVDARDLERTAPAQATQAYGKLVKAHPKCSLVWMARARHRTATGDVSAAVGDLEKAVAVDPANDEAAAALGLTLLEAERCGEAIPWLQRASDRHPAEPTLALGLAICQSQTGDLKAARTTLAKTHERHRGDNRVVLAYARVLQAQGELEAAYLVVRDAALARPDATMILALAAAAKDAGRVDEAATLLEELAKEPGLEALADTAAKLRASAKP